MEENHQHDFKFERYADTQRKTHEGRVIEEISEVIRCSCGEQERRHVLYKNEFYRWF